MYSFCLVWISVSLQQLFRWPLCPINSNPCWGTKDWTWCNLENKKTAKRNVILQAPKISEYNKHNKQEKKVNFRLIGNFGYSWTRGVPYSPILIHGKGTIFFWWSRQILGCRSKSWYCFTLMDPEKFPPVTFTLRNHLAMLTLHTVSDRGEAEVQAISPQRLIRPWSRVRVYGFKKYP